jgi:hypothetical protein
MDIGQMLAEKSLSICTIRDSYYLRRYEITLHLCENGKVFEESKSGKLWERSRFSELSEGMRREYLHGDVKKVVKNASN